MCPDKPKTFRGFWQGERKSFGRRKDNSSFYNSTRWRKVSKAFREKHKNCAMCESEGMIGPVEVADHIRGLDNVINSGGNPYSFKELQPLCHKHHNRKSGGEASRIKK